MSFCRTLNLYDPVIFSAIQTGVLRPQPGQWIRCGENNPHAAMWIGINRKSGTLYAAHWQGSRAATLRRYHSLKAAVAGRV